MENFLDCTISPSSSVSLLTTSPFKMVKILVTGGNQGLGFYLIEYLLTFPDHEVFLGSRSIEKGEEAAKKLRENSNNDKSSSVEVIQLDVSSDESIRKAAALDELKQLDVLVNNAGVLGK